MPHDDCVNQLTNSDHSNGMSRVTPTSDSFSGQSIRTYGVRARGTTNTAGMMRTIHACLFNRFRQHAGRTCTYLWPLGCHAKRGRTVYGTIQAGNAKRLTEDADKLAIKDFESIYEATSH
jgi:hypothetical protein